MKAYKDYSQFERSKLRNSDVFEVTSEGLVFVYGYDTLFKVREFKLDGVYVVAESLIDENGNINCPGCVNCERCYNCLDCVDCVGCINCRDCKDLWDSINCWKCNNGDQLEACQDCTDSAHCKRCVTVDNSCYMLICDNCKDCQDCVECSKCEKCELCYRCHGSISVSKEKNRTAHWLFV